jgi:phosphatidylinositol glycan class B
MKNFYQISLWIPIFIFRCFNTLFIGTWEHADEYYQSQEIAHSDIFGYGIRTWEWTSNEPLRGPLYVICFYPLFIIAKLLQIDSPNLIALSPRIVQAVFLTVFDTFFIKWAISKSKFDNKFFWALMLYTTRFTTSTFARTYINSAEASIFMVALYFWQRSSPTSKTHTMITKMAESTAPIHRISTFSLIQFLKDALNHDRDNHSWVFIGLNFIMRPTSLTIWPWYFIQRLITSSNTYSMVLVVLKYTLNTIIILALSVLLDFIYYQKITSTILNFIKFNFLSNQADKFGTEPSLWYFDEAIPQMCLYWSFFLILGIFGEVMLSIFKKEVPYDLLANISEVIILSSVGHKETRFLSKQLPCLVYFIGLGVLWIWVRLKGRFKYLMAVLFCVVAAMNVLSSYNDIRTSMPQKIQMVDFVRNHEIQSLGLLTPHLGHPGHSYIHKQIPIMFSFVGDPLNALKKWESANSGLDCLVVWGGYKDQVSEYIKQRSYIPVLELNHTTFLSRNKNKVTLYPGFTIYRQQQYMIEEQLGLI